MRVNALVAMLKPGTTPPQYGPRSCAHAFAISRLNSPELCCRLHPPRKQRAEGRPGAGWHPKVRTRQDARGVTTGDAGTSRPSLRNGVTAYGALSPGSDALLPPSPCRSPLRAPGRAATSPQALTHRPRASGPHAFAVRGRPSPDNRKLARAHSQCRKETL